MPELFPLPNLRRLRRRTPRRGQAMVEFGLVLPIFILLVIGLIEFALAFNANLAVNFASREAALIGAESGNDAIADCRILQTIENSIDNPADAARINEVRIYRAGVNGNELASNEYTRGGEITCEFWDGVETQEIRSTTPSSSFGYPVDDALQPARGLRRHPARHASAWPSTTPTRGSRRWPRW